MAGLRKIWQRLWFEPATGRDGKARTLIPRRMAIIVLGGGTLGMASLFGGRAACSLGGAGQVADAGDLPFAFDPEDVVRIGADYAANHALNAQDVRLALSAKLLPHMGVRQHIGEAARAAIDDDLAQGRVIIANRWVVAETEAQLCCLAALNMA